MEINVDYWDVFTPINVTIKVNLLKTLKQYDLKILDDDDGGIKMYLEEEQIAHWHKPTYVLKKDFTRKDPKERIYIEMCCQFESVFDQT